MRRTPSPVATATTAVGTGSLTCGGSSTPPPAATPSRTHRSSSTCSIRSVTRMLRGRPQSRAASIGGADVVGVDVAVPDAVAADHDDRVADAGPHVLERGDGVVVGLEEVHDLVAQVAVARGRRRRAAPCRASITRARRDRLGLGQRAAVELRAGRRRAGAGSRHRRRRPRRPASAPAAARACGPSASAPCARAASSTATSEPPSSFATAVGRLRRLPHDGEDGALDRPHHRAVGRVGRGRRAPSANAGPSTASCSRNTSDMPRRTCDRITPELPRAPMSEPWLMALQVCGHVAPSALVELARTPTRA